MMGIYSALAKSYGWTLKDMEETDIETLISFIYYKDEEANIKYINGKKYKRAAPGVVSWL